MLCDSSHILNDCLSKVLLLCLSLFFFKQKTAYEMRISDWSSDVCSSDLLSTHPKAKEAVTDVEGRVKMLQLTSYRTGATTINFKPRLCKQTGDRKSVV